ncbi:T-cell immunoreceptor with Ig and ITIM domains-like isoform X2 [Betta splendens]|uniref:T-cell immunoreceptor with Ig and ITIM domains-like isoform X2 n=1 Tax=Betta splendens TaxID=158456 RepID=UPI0010F8D63A|nr:T-cell immunoreceptor with Ig and ITIM domains-like isoform X2 [Betta splendens]XP_055359254.1 T-cell immunoreceptor with Ig and ITIM domains-like isoform X2 [Betta splendens]
MKHCESLLTLVCITLLPASEASPVTGHVGGDVILPCEKEDPNIKISQVQWDHMNPKSNHSYRILVFNPNLGLNISKSPLRDRVEISGFSLRIKNVTMTDEGTYTCRVTAYPTGVFHRTINLIVRAQSFQPSSAVIHSTVAVVLLVAVLAAIAYLTFIRCGSSVRRCAANPRSAAVDAPRREDVVYSQVKLKTPRGSASPSRHQHAGAVSQDVTYAGLVFQHQRPT